MSTKVWKIIMGVSLVAIVVSGIAVFTLSREYADGINQYKNLEQYVDIEAEPATDEEAVETDATEETPIISLNIDVDFEKLTGLDHAIDDIRKVYGEDSVMRACFLKSCHDHMSGGIAKDKRSGITKAVQ